MRPIRETWVASVITSPAAPIANWPRCMTCQSLAEPSSDMYWHIGETTMRLGNVRPRNVKGLNRALVMGLMVCWIEWPAGVQMAHRGGQGPILSDRISSPRDWPRGMRELLF